MNVKPCSCGHEACLDYIPFQGWFVCCPVAGGCGRRGRFHGSPEEAADWWEAEVNAINAAMYPKPEPEPEQPTNKVYGGEWFANLHVVITGHGDSREPMATVHGPDKGGIHDFPGVAENTARLLAASKELLRKLKEGRDLYRDGYTSTSLSTYFCSVGEIIDGLGVDVD